LKPKRLAQVILDGVFNHTGRKFFAFKDIMEKGEKWQTSQYKDWYSTLTQRNTRH
jgi:cyclomaltodextrinase